MFTCLPTYSCWMLNSECNGAFVSPPNFSNVRGSLLSRCSTCGTCTPHSFASRQLLVLGVLVDRQLCVHTSLPHGTVGSYHGSTKKLDSTKIKGIQCGTTRGEGHSNDNIRPLSTTILHETNGEFTPENGWLEDNMSFWGAPYFEVLGG